MYSFDDATTQMRRIFSKGIYLTEAGVSNYTNHNMTIAGRNKILIFGICTSIFIIPRTVLFFYILIHTLQQPAHQHDDFFRQSVGTLPQHP